MSRAGPTEKLHVTLQSPRARHAPLRRALYPFAVASSLTSRPSPRLCSLLSVSLARLSLSRLSRTSLSSPSTEHQAATAALSHILTADPVYDTKAPTLEGQGAGVARSGNAPQAVALEWCTFEERKVVHRRAGRAPCSCVIRRHGGAWHLSLLSTKRHCARKSMDQWLRDIALEQYAPVFARHHLDVSILPELTANDLDRMGITSVR